jgi:hypothetical protein
MLQPKLIIMREQLLLYLGIEAKTRSQIYLAKANAHTQKTKDHKLNVCVS